MKLYPEITAVILCAGKGERAGLGYNKLLHSLGDNMVASRSIRKFSRFDRLFVVCSEQDEDKLRTALYDLNITFVHGGSTRTDSVRNALNAIGQTDVVVIHDGARPFVTDEIIDDCINNAIKTGSGIACYPSQNALKLLDGDKMTTVDRSTVLVVQTPQAFNFDAICDAYAETSGTFADDSEVYEKKYGSITPSLGSPDNIKLTTPSDFLGLGRSYRVGFGFDVHQFKIGRPLVLCGKQFDTDYGLDGHSDADAPVHAVMDAILSAAGLPDIGVLFPDTDDTYLGADSIELLKKVMAKIVNYEVVNISVCIIAQKPKIAPHSLEMRKMLAAAMSIDVDCVNVSATTTEFLGIIGEGKGLAASADVLLRLK